MQKKNCGHFHLMVTTHFNINFNGVLYEVARRARRLPPGQWRLQCLGELENHSGAGWNFSWEKKAKPGLGIWFPPCYIHGPCFVYFPLQQHIPLSLRLSVSFSCLGSVWNECVTWEMEEFSSVSVFRLLDRACRWKAKCAACWLACFDATPVGTRRLGYALSCERWKGWRKTGAGDAMGWMDSNRLAWACCNANKVSRFTGGLR